MEIIKCKNIKKEFKMVDKMNKKIIAIIALVGVITVGGYNTKVMASEKVGNTPMDKNQDIGGLVNKNNEESNNSGLPKNNIQPKKLL